MDIQSKLDKFMIECDTCGCDDTDKDHKKKKKKKVDEVSVQKQQALAMQWEKSGVIMKLTAISKWAKETVNYANFGDAKQVKANLNSIERIIAKIKKEL